MASPQAVWVFVLANLGFIAISGSLAGLSLLAYWRNRDQRSYAIATLGFGCIVGGGTAELAFTYRFEPDYVLSSTEFLYLQAGEDALITLGFALLFFAITRHDADASPADEYALGDDAWVGGYPYDD